jgi:hypothetical protein
MMSSPELYTQKDTLGVIGFSALVLGKPATSNQEPMTKNRSLATEN